MCSAHAADQPVFSVIAAGIPFAARRLLSAVRGSPLTKTATAPSALKRRPILTGSHPDKPSGHAGGDPFQFKRARRGSPADRWQIPRSSLPAAVAAGGLVVQV